MAEHPLGRCQSEYNGKPEEMQISQPFSPRRVLASLPLKVMVLLQALMLWRCRPRHTAQALGLDVAALFRKDGLLRGGCLEDDDLSLLAGEGDLE